MKEHNGHGETEAAEKAACSVRLLLVFGFLSGIVILGGFIALRLTVLKPDDGTSN